MVNVHVLFLIIVDSYLRRTIKPLEALLTSHKRVVVKDSAVSRFGLFGFTLHEITDGLVNESIPS